MHCRLFVEKNVLVVLVNTVKRGQDHCFLYEQEVVNVFQIRNADSVWE